jgi:hypothetical protein
MSEEEKTDLQKDDSEVAKDEISRNSEPAQPAGILPNTDEATHPSTINNELPTNMETHAQELHKLPGHGFKHYFFEFFMLFLAVTLGYFVENIREHYVNKEIEKQNIESIISALASDAVQLKNIIAANEKVIRHLDSLVELRNADLRIEKNKRSFLRNSVVGFSEDWFFITNDAALQQLKSSGTLRLIRKKNIIDSIFKYESNNNMINQQHQDCYHLFKESFDDYKKAVSLFFYRDTGVMKYSLGYDNSAAVFKNVDAVTISSDKEKVNILFGDAATMAAPQEAYVALMKDQLAYAKNLITFLKKEYHLQDE